MNHEELLNRYSILWEQPELFVLEKIGSDSYPYGVRKRTGIIYPVVAIHKQILELVIKKMLDANVEVLTEPFKFSDKDLWTKRKHEFVLLEKRLPITRFDTTHTIYHLATGQSMGRNQLDPTPYNDICQNMIEAGVEVWSREKWKKY